MAPAVPALTIGPPVHRGMGPAGHVERKARRPPRMLGRRLGKDHIMHAFLVRLIGLPRQDRKQVRERLRLSNGGFELG